RLRTKAQAWLVARSAAVLAVCCGNRRARLPMFLFPKLLDTAIDRNLIISLLSSLNVPITGFSAHDAAWGPPAANPQPERETRCTPCITEGLPTCSDTLPAHAVFPRRHSFHGSERRASSVWRRKCKK